MIVIVDLGLGNLFSVKRMAEHVGGETVISDDVTIISKASKVILPGVGSFQSGMEAITHKKLGNCLKGLASSGTPILGICLGMQLLMSGSSEHGHRKGLGIIPGEVIYIRDMGKFDGCSKVPHIGWNKLVRNSVGDLWENTILKGLNESDSCYFVHSYCATPDLERDILSFSNYAGIDFVSSVRHENVTGCQFHPEKSGTVGLKIMRNFICNELSEI